MKNYIKNSDGKIIFEEILKTIQENKEYLTDLDSKLGDGDHGFNMNKGVTTYGVQPMLNHVEVLLPLVK